jgi:hypothetical protein
MNYKFRYLLIPLLIFSCKREVDKKDCVTLSQNPDWTTSDFKSNYTIQLPDNYFGNGKVGFEGNIYDKTRDDSSINFSYSYCSPLHCADFGENLSEPFPGSINITANNRTITLDQKMTFCGDHAQAAVLYYNNDNDSHARLYWKDNGEYKQALEISYKHSRHQDVLDIIKTIKEK